MALILFRNVIYMQSNFGSDQERPYDDFMQETMLKFEEKGETTQLKNLSIK